MVLSNTKNYDFVKTDFDKKKYQDSILNVAKNNPLETVTNDLVEPASPPEYTVINVESVSNIFEQGKIFATVKKPYSTNGLKLLCDKIRLDYNQYSNIVICLFSDDSFGNQIANKNDFNITNRERKKTWLAMYTYNPVEGAYFDENPGQYLGNFQN